MNVCMLLEAPGGTGRTGNGQATGTDAECGGELREGPDPGSEWSRRCKACSAGCFPSRPEEGRALLTLGNSNLGLPVSRQWFPEEHPTMGARLFSGSPSASPCVGTGPQRG